MGKTAIGQVYPVTAHVQINPPTTTYLPEFTIMGSDRLSVNLFFNDFSVPVYNARLKLTIEGNGISLVTHPSYVPPPITISPGANLFSGSDLADYLSPNHMLINGISPQALQQGGSGLPEGIYTFCVQVFDYVRPEVALSPNNCFPKLLRKNYPPTLVAPACGSTIPVLGGNQDILFQWHTNADPSIQAEYELSIVEVPPGMNPNDAMNGSSTKILDAEPVMGTTFLYGPEQLPLDLGKKYAYRVKILDALGNTTFENNGNSPVCTFYYGVNSSGMVPLISPVPNQLVSVSQTLSFSWERPTNALPGQQVYYKLKIVKLLEGQDPETALEFNPVWYEVETNVLPANGGAVLPNSLYPLPAEEDYAWEVRAYSENSGVEQEIAISEKRVYASAPAVEKFKAGNPDPNMITVLTLSKNEDLANGLKRISGEGRMQIRENGEEVVLHFTDIIVGPYSDHWQLLEGVITELLNNFQVRLDNSGNPVGDPGNLDNYGRADFYATHVVVERDDLKLRGRVKWQFPHAATGGLPVVQSEDSLIVYNRYLLVNAYVAVEGISFDLLDPYGFRITYYPTPNSGTPGGSHTKFALFNNILTLTLDGEMVTPAKAVDLSGNRVAYRFQDADNPYYFSQSGMTADRDIMLVKNTQIQLDANAAIFDLSEDESPQKISSATWKGIYFDDFNFKFPTAFDGSNQLVLNQEQSYNFEALPDNAFYAWVDAQGVSCNIRKAFAASTGAAARFNTFKGYLREIQIELEEHTVANCFIKGFVYIPVLSENEEFTYTVPFDKNGLQASFLDETLDNYTTTFRPNQPELRLKLMVKQAVFKNNERLDLVIDLDWPAIEAYIPNLTQFKIWGNGEIGFNVPGGARAITNVVGRFQGAYEITIDSVAAGFFSGTYAFNCISSIILSDEKVGMTDVDAPGPPKARFFTDEERISPSGHGPPPPPFTANYLDANHWDTYNNGAAEEAHKTGELVVYIPFLFWYPIDSWEQAGYLGVSTVAAAGVAGAGSGSGSTTGTSAAGTAGAIASQLPWKPTNSAKVVVSGAVLFRKNDPVWGNAFFGMANIQVNKPLKYNVAVKLLIGKKSKVNYGLLEIVYNANSIDYSRVGRTWDGVKGIINTVKAAGTFIKNKGKKAGDLFAPDPDDKKLLFASYNIVEIAGRLYWNMSHDVEEECGEDMKSLIHTGVDDDASTSFHYDNQWRGNFTDKEIINAMPEEDLAAMLCEYREEDEAAFRVLLNGLPAPDFDALKADVPEIPNSVWNTLKAANVNSYSHLELLFPDDWCPYIMPAVVKAAKAKWVTLYPDTMNWGIHLTHPKDEQDFVDFCELSDYNKKIMLVLIQLEQPADENYLISNNILTEAEWNSVQPVEIPIPSSINYLTEEQINKIQQPGVKTWLAVWTMYPEKNWCQIIPSMIDLDWDEVYTHWQYTSPDRVDIGDLIEKYAPTAGDWFKEFASDRFNNAFVSGQRVQETNVSFDFATNYRVDNSMDFGFYISVRMQDELTHGRGEMYKVALEMAFGKNNGQLFIRGDAGWGNRANPADTDGSMIKGKVCITYTHATRTFILDAQAQAIQGIGVVTYCGQGLVHFEAAPNLFHFQFGKQEFPIVCAPCTGIPVWNIFGFFEVHHTSNFDMVRLGLGLEKHMFLQSKRFGSDACDIYGYCNIYAAINGMAEITIDDGKVTGSLGIYAGAGADIGVNLSGYFCPFGNINALHLYLGAEIVVELPSGHGHAEIAGEATLFGIIEAKFNFDQDW